MVLVVVAFMGCKSGDKPAGEPAKAAGGACKPMADLCAKFPVADLEKLFSIAPVESYNEEHHNDSPLGPLDICNYRHDGDKENFKNNLQVTIRYGCFANGADAAANEYKGLKHPVASSGGKMEDLTGLGDEAYWYYTAANVGFVQGHIKARKGAVIVDMLYGGYRINDNNIDPAIAKQKAVELTTRIFAAAP